MFGSFRDKFMELGIVTGKFKQKNEDFIAQILKLKEEVHNLQKCNDKQRKIIEELTAKYNKLVPGKH